MLILSKWGACAFRNKLCLKAQKRRDKRCQSPTLEASALSSMPMCKSSLLSGAY